MSFLLSFDLAIVIVGYKEISFVCYCLPCAVICKIIYHIYRIIYHDSSPSSQLGIFVRSKLGYRSAFPLYPGVSLQTIVL